jgi:hypothetical protein
MRFFDSENPIAFMHIPKCAGTAFYNSLTSALAPCRAIYGFDRCMFGEYSAFEEMRQDVRNLIYLDFRDFPRDINFVSGHIGFSTLLAAYPNAQLLTVLREPISRVLSLWLYYRSLPDEHLIPWGREWSDIVRIARLSLFDFLMDRRIACQTDNQLTRLLLSPNRLIPTGDFIHRDNDSALLESAVERVKRFSFIDLIENPALVPNISAWLDSCVQISKVNETNKMPVSLQSKMSDQVTERTSELLRLRSRIDLELWKIVAIKRIPTADPISLQRQEQANSIARHSELLEGP